MNERWKKKLYEIIYEADTKAGKWFDIGLLFLICFSIVLVMLESVASINVTYGDLFLILEWSVTILFTIEYILRIISIKRPLKYIFSFYGLIDFISTIPLYVSYFFAGSHVLIAFRALRLLRVFRVLKLVRFLGEASQLKEALKASRTKIVVFIYTVLIISVILGTIMYLIEGEESGFTSIPRSIYWTIVTLTTVGYGDIAPATNLGQFVASLIMILGYGIIAVPTGIVTIEFARQSNKVHLNTQICSNCQCDNHTDEAKFCYNCGEKL
ncbi:ion transporter [Neptunitalea chrysea]|uniref:Ion transporter n=1 Tax=Neptunitalea chrysea TaxID=1647581 RepID=A0A9W6B442_9FLAO|nr:ion transporter [Neptunitalea chrysea]GLB51225.1 ion transporter [Neptunitalea chrysea]